MLSVLTSTHVLMGARAGRLRALLLFLLGLRLRRRQAARPGRRPPQGGRRLPGRGRGRLRLGEALQRTDVPPLPRGLRRDTRVARFHNVYGPYGTYDGGREKAPAALTRKVIEAKLSGDHEMVIWGTGEQTRSFMFIDDCVDGIQRIMHSDIEEPINLGSNELVSINGLVDIIEDIAGIELEREYELDAPQGVRGRNSDNTKIKQYLGWEPSISLREGLAQTYAWICSPTRSTTWPPRATSRSASRRRNTPPTPTRSGTLRLLEAIRILGLERRRASTRPRPRSSTARSRSRRSARRRPSARAALRRRQALRLLDHGELPRGLRHARLQRHPLQPREPDPRRDLRDPQDHPRGRRDPSGPSGDALAGQSRRQARLGPCARLCRGHVAHPAAGDARRLRARDRRDPHGEELRRARLRRDRPRDPLAGRGGGRDRRRGRHRPGAGARRPRLLPPDGGGSADRRPGQGLERLGWQHRVGIDALVSEMVAADLEAVAREHANGRTHG